MAYDIYGQHLRSGHCEVHPDVHQSYPCSLCFAEKAESDREREEYERYERERYEKHYNEMLEAAIGMMENTDGAGI